jgi:G3E family GTPase
MRTALARLLPPSLLSDSGATAAALWRAVLWRTNFIPGIRHRLGWRGLRGCAAGSEGVTARVEGMAGVYGLLPGRLAAGADEAEVELHLFYFPAPDEDLLESFSVQAGILAQQANYRDRQREFVGDQALCSLFQLGRLTVQYSRATGAVRLALDAPQRSRIVALDGVSAGTRQLVPPGGFDQDLPAWDAALPFFRALANAFSYLLGSEPTALWHHSRPGRLLAYGATGVMRAEETAATREHRLTLGWGACGEPVATGGEVAELAWRSPAPLPAEFAAESWWQAQLSGAANSLDKSAAGLQEKPRLIVLTGFLGAGKTSFLRHFIENQTARNGFVAVVQNEIGAKGLDSRLLGQNYAVVEVDEGCVCCTLAGSLKMALTEILSRFQPDFIVLETTGLANPAHLLAEIQELEGQLEFGAVTTLVDAALGIDTLDRHPVARDQLLLADVVVVNKIDQVTAAQRACLEGKIREINSLAPIHWTAWGDVAPAALYGANFRELLRATAPPLAGERRPTHGEQGLSSLLLTLSRPLERLAFLRGLEPLLPHLLRIKGVVELAEEGESQIYQYVPGSHSFEPAGEADGGDRFLIFIGSDLPLLAPSLRQVVGIG